MMTTIQPAERSRAGATGVRLGRALGLCAVLALLTMLLAACGNSRTPGGVAAAAAAPTATAVVPTVPAPTATTPAATATQPYAAVPKVIGTRAAGTPVVPTTVPTAAPAARRYAIVSGPSKATYKAKETFIGQGLSEAEGTTTAVEGALLIDRQNPSLSTIGPITVDVSKLKSDSGQRDQILKGRALETDKFPTATFVAKRLDGLPTTPYTDGQELIFTIVGDLTIHGTTRETTFEAKGKIIGDTFTGTATTRFNMTDFGVQPPDVARAIKVENGMTLELTIEARQQ